MIKSLGSRALKANSCCQNRLNWDNFFLDLCYSKTSPICGPNYKRSMIISYDASIVDQDWILQPILFAQDKSASVLLPL